MVGVGPGHELVDLTGGVAVDEAAEDVGEIGLGFDGVELAGLDQRGDHAPVDAALIGAGEQGVLAIEGDRADRALDRVGVDLDATVVEEEAQPGPQLESVADGLGDAGAAGDFGELDVEPDPQVIDDGLALRRGRLAAARVPGRGSLPLRGRGR